MEWEHKFSPTSYVKIGRKPGIDGVDVHTLTVGFDRPGGGNEHIDIYLEGGEENLLLGMYKAMESHFRKAGALLKKKKCTKCRRMFQPRSGSQKTCVSCKKETNNG